MAALCVNLQCIESIIGISFLQLNITESADKEPATPEPHQR